MKIVGRTQTLLFEGDRVECSISHGIKIGRESSWVKYGVNTGVQENESAEEAASRVITHVDREVMNAVHRAVDTVNGVTNAVR